MAKSLAEAGLRYVNPSDPEFRQLLAAGVTQEEFCDAAREALHSGKSSVGYVIAMIAGRRRDAAARSRLPPKFQAVGPVAHRPYVRAERPKRDRDAPLPECVKALAEKLGIASNNAKSEESGDDADGTGAKI